MLVLKFLKTGYMVYWGRMEFGKSTTMNIMCGVLKQTKGNVFVKGINMREHAVGAKRHIGFFTPEATFTHGFNRGGVFEV